MLHPGLSRAASLGETEAGHQVAGPPRLEIAQRFLETWLLWGFFKCYYLIHPTVTGC